VCFDVGICVGGNDDDGNINLVTGLVMREGIGLGYGMGCRF